MSKEIVRACGRLVFELFHADQKDGYAKPINNDDYAYTMALGEVRSNIYNKALSIMEL